LVIFARGRRGNVRFGEVEVEISRGLKEGGVYGNMKYMNRAGEERKKMEEMDGVRGLYRLAFGMDGMCM
jgi:hypothetical protein